MLFSPKPMHIPDGFLGPWVAIGLWAISALFIGLALQRSRRQLGERTVPLMGVLGAFIFAAQAINFPVAGGTSGHLVGAALAAILLGPWPAVLVMSCVVVVQGLLFQDGGLLAMGGNLLNMAVLGTLLGYTAYRVAWRALGSSLPARLAGSFFGAWVAVVGGAMAAAVELSASGTAPLRLVLPAMTLVHMAIGLGEGLITLGALSLVQRVRPDLLDRREQGGGTAALAGAGLLVALIVALFSPLASPLPDGLETVANRLSFAGRAQGPLFRILPEYGVRGMSSPAASTVLAVAAGTLLVFGLALALGRLAGRQAARAESS